MKCKHFRDYIIYEDGSVYNRFNNLVKPVIKNNRLFIKLSRPGNKGRDMLSLPRLMYNLFVGKFDITDQKFCVTFQDGNPLNIKLNNLVLIKRKGLNFKSKLDKLIS